MSLLSFLANVYLSFFLSQSSGRFINFVDLPKESVFGFVGSIFIFCISFVSAQNFPTSSFPLALSLVCSYFLNSQRCFYFIGLRFFFFYKCRCLHLCFPVCTLLFLHPISWYIVFSFSTSSIFPKKIASEVYYCVWFEAGIYLMSFSSAEWCFPSPGICWDPSVTHHRVRCVSQSSVLEMVLVRMSLRNGLSLLPAHL